MNIIYSSDVARLWLCNIFFLIGEFTR